MSDNLKNYEKLKFWLILLICTKLKFYLNQILRTAPLAAEVVIAA